MYVLALAIPLTCLLTCSNLCAAATACGPRLFLNTSAHWQPLFTSEITLLLVMFAHGSGFPLTDATPHELWAVGFANIFALDKDVEHSHVPSVVIQVKLTARQSREQS